MLIFNERIAPRLPRLLVVDYVNLEQTETLDAGETCYTDNFKYALIDRPG